MQVQLGHKMISQLNPPWKLHDPVKNARTWDFGGRLVSLVVAVIQLQEDTTNHTIGQNTSAIEERVPIHKRNGTNGIPDIPIGVIKHESHHIYSSVKTLVCERGRGRPRANNSTKPAGTIRMDCLRGSGRPHAVPAVGGVNSPIQYPQ